jgi:DNA-binding GntR family transcriptional regulator
VQVNPSDGSLPPSLFTDLDRSGPLPLYYQLASRIEAAIADGSIAPGSRIENEVALAQRLRLSRPTIRRAIQELVDKGLLVRRRGIGTQVVHGKVTRNLALTSLYEDLSRTHQHPSTALLLYEVIGAEAKIAEHLNVGAGEPVLHLRRLRNADGVPVSILENFLPEPFVDISSDDLEDRGLYQILRNRGVAMRIAQQNIGARNANAEEGKLLDIPRNSALLTMERTVYDNAGRAIEFGHHSYRPDLYSFEVTLVDK